MTETRTTLRNSHTASQQYCEALRAQARSLLADLTSLYPWQEVDDATDEFMPWFELQWGDDRTVVFTWDDVYITVCVYDGTIVAQWPHSGVELGTVLQWYREVGRGFSKSPLIH
jgi:hypothetical protein